MKYLTTQEIAKLWSVSERSVRNYCSLGRVPGSFIDGKTWYIPYNAERPRRSSKKKTRNLTLLGTLKIEKESKIKGRIYHKLQIEMTYNSNHIEGSKLSHEQTNLIFDTNTISLEKCSINIDDIIETFNHFRCIDFVIDVASKKLTEPMIKQLHYILKSSTSDSRISWFNVGDYKLEPNEVGERPTTAPKDVKREIQKLLNEYNNIKEVTIEDIIDFHYKFEAIHPFQDGNGRVGRLIMLKECLKHNFTPILIKDDFKSFYYRGLNEYHREKGYLIDTCLHGQDIFKQYIIYFNKK